MIPWTKLKEEEKNTHSNHTVYYDGRAYGKIDIGNKYINK